MVVVLFFRMWIIGGGRALSRGSIHSFDGSSHALPKSNICSAGYGKSVFASSNILVAYGLVQAKKEEKVLVTSAARGRYSNVIDFIIMLTAMNCEIGWHRHFFVQDLTLALAAKMCPHRPRAFETVNNGKAQKAFFLFFHERAGSRYVPQGTPSKRFSQLLENLTA